MARVIRGQRGTRPAVQISENDGVRLLHIGGDAIQSAIRLSSPEALELEYTRAMMVFLLFHPHPRDIAMIGLGGGSIARFVHARMPASRIAVVEVSADVVDAARRHFGLPQDDHRLSVIEQDGSLWVPQHPQCADVLLLDAFEDGKQVGALCSESFYAAARAALKPAGMLVANFIADDRKLGTWLDRIDAAFGGQMLKVAAEDGVNLIVLAFCDGPPRIAWTVLRERARLLQDIYGLPLPGFLPSLKALNNHTRQYLLLSR